MKTSGADSTCMYLLYSNTKTAKMMDILMKTVVIQLLHNLSNIIIIIIHSNIDR